MVDKDLVAAKLAELGSRAARAKARCPASADGLKNDRDALDLVSFNLMLAMQSALDIASHVISDEGWEPATTLSSAFERLEERGVISQASRDAMSRGASFRNLVAHGYAAVDVEKVHRAATQGVDELERFSTDVAKWLSGS